MLSPAPDSLVARTRAAYHAAADHYDGAALSFWSRFGRATIERMQLGAGATVLDVCCGSGASALPAADRVGPRGRVLGLDLAPGLIGLARAKAGRAGLANVTFREEDFAACAEPDASFDAVVCVFGIFFAPDMRAAVERLWRWVRPGGELALTTWGPRVFEPANGIFWDAVRAVRPELHKSFNPWDRISTPMAVLSLLRAAGVTDAVAAPERSLHPLRSPEDWWSIVQGSGYRGILDQLTAAERDRVRAQVLAELGTRSIARIETNVIYAQARKGRG